MNPLTAEQQDRAMSCYRLAGSLGRRANKRVPGFEDEYRGCATVALVEAASVYDPANPRRARFSTFAHILVMQAVHRETLFLFRHQRDRRRERLTPCPPERAETPVPSDDAFAAMLALVPPRTAAFLRLRYADGLSLVEIGARHGLKKQAVSEVIRRGLAKLRAHPAVARHREAAP